LFITDVSGHRIGVIVKGQDIHEEVFFFSDILTIEGGKKLSRNVHNELPPRRCETSQKIEDIQRHIRGKTVAAFNQLQRIVGLGASSYGRYSDTASFLFYCHKPVRTMPVVARRQKRALPVHTRRVQKETELFK
jgi:hypothetical protein